MHSPWHPDFSSEKVSRSHTYRDFAAAKAPALSRNSCNPRKSTMHPSHKEKNKLKARHVAWLRFNEQCQSGTPCQKKQGETKQPPLPPPQNKSSNVSSGGRVRKFILLHSFPPPQPIPSPPKQNEKYIMHVVSQRTYPCTFFAASHQPPPIPCPLLAVCNLGNLVGPTLSTSSSTSNSPQPRPSLSTLPRSCTSLASSRALRTARSEQQQLRGDVNTAFDSLEHSRRGTCVWKLFALAFEGQCGVVKRVVDIVREEEAFFSPGENDEFRTRRNSSRRKTDTTPPSTS